LYGIASAGAANIVGSVLYPLTPVDGYVNEPEFAAGGQTVGILDGSGVNSNDAVLWTAAGPIDLNPTQIPGINISVALGTDGTQQVGYGAASALSSTSTAILWTGTAAGAVDLNPADATSSAAIGTNGTQQVGFATSPSTGGNGHAFMWTGTAGTGVDLNPTNLTGISGSQAVATDGTQQVGSGQGSATNNETWAMMWSGSASTAVLLNPTNLSGYNQSFALGVGGNQQVGWGFNTILDKDRALLWTGSAASAVDLTPTNLSGFASSTAYDTNGVNQVGYASGSATGNNVHAMFWTDTANSAVDLQALLPSTGVWSDSEAYTIDASGNIYGTADGIFGGASGGFAVEWSVVPEPAGASMLLIAGAATFMRRRCSK